MIHIIKDQIIAENENLRVATATGDYEDTALIEFYDIKNPDFIAGAFQAQFIIYGGLVYLYNDHIELGNTILEIDPNSTHTSASYVRMNNELLAKMNNGTLEPESLNQTLNAEKENMENQMVDTEKFIEEKERSIEEIEKPIEENVPVENMPEENVPVENETIVEPIPEEVIEQEVLPENIPAIEDVVAPEVITTEEPVSMIKRKVKRKIG